MSKLDDSSLIKIDQEIVHKKTFLNFIFKIIFIFVALALIWSLGANKFIENTIPLCFTTTESNLAKIIKVVSQPVAQVVLVGTSVMDRLEPQFFSVPGVANLALEGGSSVTGLEIILRGQLHPTVVYIETNFVSNHPNSSLLSETTGNRLSLILSGQIKPLRYLFSSKKYVSAMDDWKSKQNILLKNPPTDYNNADIIQKGADWYNSEAGKNGRANPAPMINRINEIATQLEKKGIRVFYVHIPLAKPYEDTDFFKGYSAAISGNDNYECSRCVDLSKNLDISQLRWGDGIHLDDRSAILVARVIESHIKSLDLKP